MDGKRLDNGARARMDGKGTSWSNGHRNLDELGGMSYLMDDIDTYSWVGGPVSPSSGIPWVEDSEDHLFMEYEPDSFDRFNQPDRKFGLVAIFDHKVSEKSATLPRSVLSSNFQRFVCRAFARSQPVAPGFFYVIGPKDKPGPWELIRVNLKTGVWEQRWTITDTKARWQEVWQAAGLAQARNKLHWWIKKGG